MITRLFIWIRSALAHQQCRSLYYRWEEPRWPLHCTRRNGHFGRHRGVFGRRW